MADSKNLLHQYGIEVDTYLHNAPPAVLYEEALSRDKSSALADTGALIIYSGAKTGRSPRDKRIVEHEDSASDIWWGDINIKVDDHTFMVNRERATDYLNTRDRLYILDGFAGWDPEHQIKVRIICSRAYHALFMHNMLIRPTKEELANFGEPDYVIFNAGAFPANRLTHHMTSKTSIDLSFERQENGHSRYSVCWRNEKRRIYSDALHHAEKRRAFHALFSK